MIKLKNLKKNRNIIDCLIFPEDSKFSGHLSVDIISGEIINYDLPKGYEYCTSHVNHARNEILRLSSKEKLPEKAMVMWY